MTLLHILSCVQLRFRTFALRYCARLISVFFPVLLCNVIKLALDEAEDWLFCCLIKKFNLLLRLPQLLEHTFLLKD